MSYHLILTTRDNPWQTGNHVIETDTDATPNLSVTKSTAQTWRGWGGCFNELGWLALSKLEPDPRQSVLRELFDPADGCRFNYCRLPIGASDYAAEWYSHNETPNDFEMENFSIDRDRQFLLPYIRAAHEIQPDLTLFASPWSPPTWMKHPRAYNYGTMIWKPEILHAYALYFAKFVEAYADEGIPIAQVHVQNEPIADQKFPSCVWTGAQLRDFIRDYLAPVFAKHGLDTEIWLGTLNMDDYAEYVDTVLSDPKASQAITGVGLQWLGKHMAQQINTAWPDKPIIQTENECGNGENSWDYAKYVFNLIRHYLSNGTVAYAYWNMVLQPGGESTWGWHQNSMVTADPESRAVTYNPEFYVMKHFSRFIAPGAKRLQTAGSLTANAVAFRNPDASTVAVLANPLRESRTCIIDLGEETVQCELPPESFATILASET